MSRSTESTIVTKCALVMDVLSDARQPLVFSDIVEKTGFVKSSCHRILAVLQGEDLVSYDKATRTYQTGARLHTWARSAWRRIDLQQIAAAGMTGLAEQSGMNVALSVMDADTILYLRTVDMVPVRFASHSGDHAPLHCTAAGKMFLAHLAGARAQAILTTLRLEQFTEFTKTSLDDLTAEFATIRAQGFAQAIGEEVRQITGIAAPIFNAQGDVTAGLSLWAMVEVGSPQRVLDQAPQLLAAAHAISAKLGWAAP